MSRIAKLYQISGTTTLSGVYVQEPRLVGDPRVLSGGIGTALITTAAGLIVAIPSLFAYRYLRGVVDLLVVDMEKEAIKLVRAFDQMGLRAGRAARRREAAS